MFKKFYNNIKKILTNMKPKPEPRSFIKTMSESVKTNPSSK